MRMDRSCCNGFAIRDSLLSCFVLIPLLGVWNCASVWAETPWKRHTIDDTSRGADGARPMDINGDGLMDLATAWEEGGLARVYLHPGPAKCHSPWPRVTVGKVKSPEDSVLADLDGDGAADVISSCEGGTKTLFVHWAPSAAEDYLKQAAWKTEPIPVTAKARMWMYCAPLQIDGRHGVDLVAGAKGPGAAVGWLQAPLHPRQLDQWKWHSLYQAGWIMSVETIDLDGDGDHDLVVSDRKGKSRGVLWLENPGADQATGSWREHRLGGHDHEVMFLDVADANRDGRLDIVAMTIADGIHFYLQQAGDTPTWQRHKVDPPQNTGRGKAVRLADLNDDERLDLVVSCETSNPPKSGVVWMTYRQELTDRTWETHTISGPEGIKFDQIQLIDIDGDGDRDLVTCEERAGLGLFWYENPAR